MQDIASVLSAFKTGPERSHLLLSSRAILAAMTQLPRLAPKLALRSLTLAAAAILAAAVPATLSLAQSSAPYTVVESGRSYQRLQDAVDAIGNGTGTIRLASASFSDCAVQAAGDVAYVAEVPGQSVFNGTACEGKAALVLRGRAARIQGLVFANMTVPDANGAGIRLEKGNLTVSQAWFRDSEQGILTADDPGSTIAIDKSTFTRLGRCDRGMSCAHSIYIGDYGALTVTRSRFEQGKGGHYVKSRAARTAVINSSFDDTGGRDTNYMIDLSNGSTGKISGNWFVQGRNKENHTTLISVAPEGKQHSSAGLVIEGNDARVVSGAEFNSAFVADWSGGDRLQIGANTVGAGLHRYEKR